MKVLMLDAPQELLDERRRIGADRRDEVWDGLLYLVPPLTEPHQLLGDAFFQVASAIAMDREIHSLREVRLFRAADDYRVPDQVYCREEHLSGHGAEGAELVVEIRSPEDETYEKIDFYADRGVREMLIMHPEERRAEMYRAYGGRLLRVLPASGGVLGSDVLGIWMRTVDGKLRITWDGGSADI